MNSFAHYSFGAVGRWMFQYVAGIDTDGPGFRQLVLKPHVGDGLDWIEARYASICGEISSRWWHDDNRVWQWRVTIPANTKAVVYVPSAGNQRVQVTEGTDFAKLVRSEAGYSVFEAPAGTYEFTVSAGERKD